MPRPPNLLQHRLAWLVACAALLAGCGDPQPPRLGSGSGGGARVVSLHDVTTEIVVRLGAGDRLVGVSEPTDMTEELLQAVARVPRAAGLESLLGLEPTLVLGLGVVAERDPDLVRRLRAGGVEVLLADPATLDDVYALTRAVGARLGNAQAAEALVAELRTRVDRDPPPAARPRRVFVYDCCDPPFTACGRTVLSDLIARAGGRNVFADLDADWAHVSWEEVVARKPELIVVHAYAHEGQADVPGKLRALQAIPSLSSLPHAVVPLGCSLGGLRSAEGVERLRAALREPS